MHPRSWFPRWPIVITLIAISVTGSFIVANNILSPKPDFKLSASLNPLPERVARTPSEANSGTQFTTITANSLRGFSGIVTLQTVAPSGISANLYGPNFVPNNIILLGFSGNLSLWIGAAAVGNYTVQVVASSGTLSHSIPISVIVQNLTMVLTPTTLTIAHGTSGTAQTRFTSVNGLSGNFSLGSQTWYYDMYGVVHCCYYATKASFTASSIVIQTSGSVTMTLTVKDASTSGGFNLFIEVDAQRGPDWQFQTFLSVAIT